MGSNCTRLPSCPFATFVVSHVEPTAGGAHPTAGASIRVPLWSQRHTSFAPLWGPPCLGGISPASKTHEWFGEYTYLDFPGEINDR